MVKHEAEISNAAIGDPTISTSAINFYPHSQSLKNSGKRLKNLQSPKDLKFELMLFFHEGKEK